MIPIPQIWLLLGTLFAATCLASPQRPNKQGRGVVQPRQNKKQQAANNKPKINNAQSGQRKAAPGRATANKPPAVQTNNGNWPNNQQKKFDLVKSGAANPVNNNKKVASRIGVVGGAAAGAAIGGAAVMSMPAIWKDEMPVEGGDSNGPPGAAVDPFFPGGDVGRDYMSNMGLCVMPYMPFLPFPKNTLGPDFPLPMLPPMPPLPPMMWPNSDEPPTISADADPQQAKSEKMQWLLMRAMQNEPYSVDDPRLNLSDEEKSEISGTLSALPKIDLPFGPWMGGVYPPSPFAGGPFMQQGIPDTLTAIQSSVDAAPSIGAVRQRAVAVSAV